MDRHRKRLRGRVPETRYPGSLNHLHGAFLLVFLWPIILICLVHGLYLVYLRTLPHAHMHLLAKVILLERHIKRTSLGLTLLWPTRSLSVCVVREVSWLREQEISGPSRAQPSCLNCPTILILEFWSTGNDSPIALPWGGGGGHLPPSSVETSKDYCCWRKKTRPLKLMSWAFFCVWEDASDSGLPEIIPLICTLAIWGQCTVLSHPESPQGSPLGWLSADGLVVAASFVYWYDRQLFFIDTLHK